MHEASRQFNVASMRPHAVICLTRAREWGPELRALEGGGQNLPPANSAPMKPRITKFLWKVVWQKISIMSNFVDNRPVSSM